MFLQIKMNVSRTRVAVSRVVIIPWVASSVSAARVTLWTSMRSRVNVSYKYVLLTSSAPD